MNNHMLLINLFVETLLNSFGQFFYTYFIWLLIGWWVICQPIGSLDWKCMLIDIDFSTVIFK